MYEIVYCIGGPMNGRLLPVEKMPLRVPYVARGIRQYIYKHRLEEIYRHLGLVAVSGLQQSEREWQEVKSEWQGRDRKTWDMEEVIEDLTRDKFGFAPTPDQVEKEYWDRVSRELQHV